MAEFDCRKALELSQGAPVLVSACLLGEPCRYDGCTAAQAEVVAFSKLCDVVPVCPEQLGGLPTPRVPSEQRPGGGVVNAQGADCTEQFLQGARLAVNLAREHGCKLAVLKSKSPSCGVTSVYDGTFSGVLKQGEGVAAAALREAGIALLEA